MNRKIVLEDQIVQRFPYRCPYCDQLISYDQFNLMIGENEIKCPSCKKKYIKVVPDGLPPHSFSPIEREGRGRGPHQRGGNNEVHRQMGIRSSRNFPAKKRNKS